MQGRLLSSNLPLVDVPVALGVFCWPPRCLCCALQGSVREGCPLPHLASTPFPVLALGPPVLHAGSSQSGCSRALPLWALSGRILKLHTSGPDSRLQFPLLQLFSVSGNTIPYLLQPGAWEPAESRTLPTSGHPSHRDTSLPCGFLGPAETQTWWHCCDAQ